MGISQPEVSRLFKGHFREYSVERLMEFLTAFDRDVEIVSNPARNAILHRFRCCSVWVTYLEGTFPGCRTLTGLGR